MKNYYKILLVFLVMNVNMCYSLIDTECIVERTKTKGICKPLRECLNVRRSLHNGIQPNKCGNGFKNSAAIVSCPNQMNKETELSKPTTPKHKQKCLEYSKSVHKIIIAQPFVIDVAPIRSESKKCDHEKVNLIVGGKNVKAMEFPHSALLGYLNKNKKIVWLCGGSLISPLFVLTAGHCTNDVVVKVRLGALSINQYERTTKDIYVSSVIKYPEYVKRYKYHDIALLKLQQQVKFNEYIKPICFPDGNESTEKTIATGWGNTIALGTRSNSLQKVVLELFPQIECAEKFEKFGKTRNLPHGIVEKIQLCAGSHTEAKDTCQGDSGGPLQIYHPTVYCSYTQVGITSFGASCGSVNFPALYTRLAFYVNWIERIVWPDENSP